MKENILIKLNIAIQKQHMFCLLKSVFISLHMTLVVFFSFLKKIFIVPNGLFLVYRTDAFTSSSCFQSLNSPVNFSCFHFYIKYFFISYLVLSLFFKKGHFSLVFEIMFQNTAVTLPADCVDVSIQQ